jgi:acetyl-CoA carboxylase biotin carboxyl carrier protein
VNKYQFVCGAGKLDTSVEKAGPGWRVTIGQSVYEVEALHDGLFALTDGDHRLFAAGVKHKGIYYIDLGRVQLELTEASDAASIGVADEQHRVKDKVFAPMPGRVVKIMVSVGDVVTERQQLVIVEAMKMENPVFAPAAGKVKAIHFAQGDQVDTESPLVELEL